MKTFARVMWIVAAVWLVLAIFGAEDFHELYGGTPRARFSLFAFIIALIPSANGWWATAAPRVDPSRHTSFKPWTPQRRGLSGGARGKSPRVLKKESTEGKR
jgi:hypothetical protein